MEIFFPVIKCHVKTKFAPLEYIEGICEDESMGKDSRKGIDYY